MLEQSSTRTATLGNGSPGCVVMQIELIHRPTAISRILTTGGTSQFAAVAAASYLLLEILRKTFQLDGIESAHVP